MATNGDVVLALECSMCAQEVTSKLLLKKLFCSYLCTYSVFILVIVVLFNTAQKYSIY